MKHKTSAHAKYKGPVGKKIKTKAEARKIFNDPRQAFWPGLPPARHREPGFESLPGVAEKAKAGLFAKYVFHPNGSKTYIYYAK